jgi:hypothetical protein
VSCYQNIDYELRGNGFGQGKERIARTRGNTATVKLALGTVQCSASRCIASKAPLTGFSDEMYTRTRTHNYNIQVEQMFKKRDLPSRTNFCRKFLTQVNEGEC